MYRTKYEFMDNLEKELNRFGVADKREIITDFQQHFTNGLAEGLTEAEICSKLGDISDIAKSYAEEEIYPAVAIDPPPAGGIGSGDAPPPQQTYTPPPFPQPDYVPPLAYNYTPPPGGEPKPSQNSGSNINGSGLVVALLIDLFVLSWAIPAMFGIIAGFIGAMFGLFVGGIATIIGGATGNLWGFISPFPQLSTIFLGIMLVAIGGLLGLAGGALIKLAVKAIRAIIDWHGKMIIGRPILGKKGAEA